MDRLARFDPKSTSTAIGDTLRDLLNRKRGQPLAGIFLATDGANNHGGSPMEAAQLATQEGVPLYICGVGSASPSDILVDNLATQEVAFLRDDLPVSVRIRARELKSESGTLVMRLLPRTDAGEGDIVATKQITFGGEEGTLLLRSS